MKFTGTVYNPGPMSVEELKARPTLETKEAIKDACGDVMHELAKVSRRVKVAAADMIATEYATARHEKREPAVDARAVLLAAWAAVTAS